MLAHHSVTRASTGRKKSMKRLAIVFAALSIVPLLSFQAAAQRLIPAHPFAPVAFTFPAVRDYTETVRVRGVHVVRRSTAHRRTIVRPRHYARANVWRSYEISDWGHHALRTGWRPLPYEFGPYSARVAVLR